MDMGRKRICDFNCFECDYEDCVAEVVKNEGFAPYMSFKSRWVDELLVEELLSEWLVRTPYEPRSLEPMNESQQEAMFGKFHDWCASKRIMPASKRDFEILHRAFIGNYSGKKLEHALYKVRHRDKYLMSKRKNRKRRRIRNNERRGD